MDFRFQFLLEVAKLTGPAGEGAAALTKFERALSKSAAALDKLERGAAGAGGKVAAAATRIGEKLDRLDRPARSGGAQTNLRKIADEWERMADRAAKAEAKKTAAAERESARRVRMAEREIKAWERAEQKKYDKSLRGSFLGGHRSFNGLLMERAQAKIGGAGSGIADSIVNAPGALLGGIGGLAVSGISMAASAAWDLARAGAEGAFSFGKMAISAQALREQSVEGFKAVYGGGTADGGESIAQGLTDRAIYIAKMTKFDTKDVVETFNTLAAGGFKSNELEGRFGGYADVASARGNGYARRYLTGIQKLNAQPSALFATFQQAAMAGPGLKLAEEVLAKQLGIKDDGNRDAKIRKMFRDKKITGAQALTGVEGAVSQRYDQGGALGSYAERVGSGTWEGLISNIKNGLGDVLAMKLDPGHPMMKFKDLLAKIGGKGGMFDELSDSGKKFKLLMSDLMEDVFRIFDVDGDDTQTAIDKLLVVADKLEKKFRQLSFWIKDSIIPLFVESFKSDAPIMDSIIKLAGDLGVRIGWGIVKGIKGAYGDTSPVQFASGISNSPFLTGHGFVDMFKGLASIGQPDVATKYQQMLTSEGSPLLAQTDSPPKTFATGGVVPGPNGAPRLVIAHGGETFHGLGRTADMAGSGMVVNIGNFTVQLDGAGKNGEQLIDEMMAALMQRVGQNTRGPSAASLRGAS